MDRGQEQMLMVDINEQEGENEDLAGAIEGLRREIVLRKRAEEALQNQVQFEKLLADIAARFVNVADDKIENEIKDSQRRICEFLGIDRTTLWLQSLQENELTRLIYVHQSPVAPKIPKQLDAQNVYPWSLNKLLKGETLVIPRVAGLPTEAACDRETWDMYGTKSTLVVPIFIGQDSLFGALSFATTQEERDWPTTIVQGLQLLAQVFAHALERDRSVCLLQEGEARLSLVTEAAGAGLWSVNLKTGQAWITPRIRELFNFAPEQEVVYESFIKVIHPDDRERFRQAVDKARQPGENLMTEYRVKLPAGNIRWIYLQGKMTLGVNEESDRLVGVLIDITERKEIEQQLKERLSEIEQLKQRLEHENVFLREEAKLHVGHNIVGQSMAIRKVLAQAEQVATTDSTVLIMGETGTGKELLARAIHRMSRRQGWPLVTVNCASLPPTLIESELFGRERGAYTGAMTKMIGRFEVADGSTLFLDEIGELSIELQNKLLRVLEEGVFERLGSTKPIKVNIRLIAATNRDLVDDVKTGRFRKDLYYRLNVFPIMIPPLRERAEDIPLMVWTFVNEFQQRMGKRIETISKKGMEAMKLYSWPGNVRELRNVIERAMITTRGEILNVTLPLVDTQETFAGQNLQEVERRHILSVLEKTHWRVTGKGSAAEVLGLKRSTLQSKMKKLGIRRPGN